MFWPAAGDSTNNYLCVLEEFDWGDLKETDARCLEMIGQRGRQLVKHIAAFDLYAKGVGVKRIFTHRRLLCGGRE